MLVIPQGYPRRIANIDPNFNSVAQRCAASPSSAEPVTSRPSCRNMLRRAFSTSRNGRRGPAIVEIPTDMWNEEVGDLDYTPVGVHKYGPDPADVRKAAAAILAREAAGDLRRHRRALGRGLGRAARTWPNCWAPPSPPASAAKARSRKTIRCRSAPAATRCRSRCIISSQKADLIIGIGCSFTETNFGIKFPKGKTVHPRHARSQPPEQGRGQRRSAWSATPG